MVVKLNSIYSTFIEPRVTVITDTVLAAKDTVIKAHKTFLFCFVLSFQYTGKDSHQPRLQINVKMELWP